MGVLFGIIFITLLILFVSRIIAIAYHAVGGHPPDWLIEPMSNDQPRILSWMIVLGVVYILVSLFFDFPRFDLIAQPNWAENG